MLRKIYEYGLLNKEIKNAVQVVQKGKIRAYIRLDDEGNFERIETIDKKSENEVLVPSAAMSTWANGKAVPFVNKIKYVIPSDSNSELDDEEKKKEKEKEKKLHEKWIYWMEDACENVGDSQPIIKFIRNLEINKKLQEQVNVQLENIKRSESISFKINGKYVLNYLNYEPYFLNLLEEKKNSKTDENKYISSITGEQYLGKSDISKQGDGTFIASFNHPSFTHYGMEGTENSGISQEESEIIINTLEYLRKSKENYNGNFNLMYWYDTDGVENIVKESLDSDFEEDDEFSDKNINASEANYVMRDLLKAAKTGNEPLVNYDAEYVMFNYEKTGDSRNMIYNYHIGQYNDLAINLFKWYKDSAMDVISEKGNLKRSVLKNFYRILYELLEHPESKDKDKINKEFGKNKNEFLETIYQLGIIPKLFVKKAIIKANRDMITKKDDDLLLDKKTSKKISAVAVQMLKVYLIREEENCMIEEKLNENNENTSYQLGRYFAVCEELQPASSNSNTRTVGNLFGGMQKAPDKLYPKLVNLSKIYIDRLEDKGLAIYYDGLLREIGAKVYPENLKRMSRIDRAEFILGYYQEKVELFRKKENKEGK